MRVYIAGPISRGDLVANINQATEAFVALAKAGFSPMCPHWSVYSKPARRGAVPDDPHAVYCHATIQGNDLMTHADWLNVDLPWVEVSDAVLRLPGASSGADLEVVRAGEKGIPVFGSVADLVVWRDRLKAA